jgi:hypothetical protein
MRITTLPTTEHPPRPQTVTVYRPRGVRLGAESWMNSSTVVGPLFPFDGEVRLRFLDAPPESPFVECATTQEIPAFVGPADPSPWDLIRAKLNTLSVQYRERANGAGEGERALLVEFEALLSGVSRAVGAFAPRYVAITDDAGAFDR